MSACILVATQYIHHGSLYEKVAFYPCLLGVELCTALGLLGRDSGL